MPWPNPLIHIVDDDPVFTKFIKSSIESNGFDRVKTFESGEAFLASLKENPAIVFLDFSMKGLNGLDVIREIKGFKPRTIIVMVTVINDGEVEEKCLKLGAADYLVKEDNKLEDLKTNILGILEDTVRDIRRKYIVAGFGFVAMLVLIYLMIRLTP